MKRILCMMIAVLLCAMNCLGSLADENIKSNESEGNSSTILTYGPLTFDTNGEWIASGLYNEGNLLYDSLASIYDPSCYVGFLVQDIWNDLMPVESRIKLEAKGITQDDYNNIEMARAYLVDHVNEVGANPDDIKILEIGNYPYAYIVAPFDMDYGGKIITHNAPTYYTIIDGYLIMFYLMGTDTFTLLYHDNFVDMLSTMSIEVVDSLTGN